MADKLEIISSNAKFIKLCEIFVFGYQLKNLNFGLYISFEYLKIN